MDKHTDLDNPEVVKGYIANLDKRSGYKRNLCFAYNINTKVHNPTWEKPIYCQNAKLPKSPQEARIDTMKASASEKLAPAISISKDTRLRPIAVMQLRPRELDLGNKIIYPAIAKHG